MKKGFTLIELLVVIAIIGILSGVVLTGLSSARTKAKDSRVVSSLKQAKTVVELNSKTGDLFPKLEDLFLVSDFSKLRQDVCAQQGVTCPSAALNNLVPTTKRAGIIKVPTTSTSRYCLYAWLPSSKSSGWNKAVCMDSKGKTNLNYTGSYATPCKSDYSCY